MALSAAQRCGKLTEEEERPAQKQQKTGAHRRAQNRGDHVRRTVLLRQMKLLGVAVQPVMFYFVWAHCYAVKMPDAYMWRGNLAVAALYGVVMMLFTRVYRGYEVGNLDWQELFASHALAQFLTNTLFYGLSFFLCERLVSPLLLVAIPLPGTGAWTGALVASLLNMRLKRAVPIIFVGVVIAGLIITALTWGVTALV